VFLVASLVDDRRGEDLLAKAEEQHRGITDPGLNAVAPDDGAVQEIQQILKRKVAHLIILADLRSDWLAERDSATDSRSFADNSPCRC
jgi:hypothetical protein